METQQEIEMKHEILLDLRQYIEHFSPLIGAGPFSGLGLGISWVTKGPYSFHNETIEERRIIVVDSKLYIMHSGPDPIAVFPPADPAYRKKILLHLCKVARKKPYSNLSN